MTTTTAPRAGGDTDRPALKLFPPAPDPHREKDIVIDVFDPGCYRLRLWSRNDMARIPAEERPDDLLIKDDVYFTFESAPE